MLDHILARYARVMTRIVPARATRVVSWGPDDGPRLSLSDRLRLDPSVLAAGSHRSGA